MASPPQIDFSILGDLGQTYQKAKQQAVRDQVLGQLGQGSGPLDYGQAAKALFGAGDVEGGMSLARLGQQQYLTSPEYITKAKTAEAQVAEQFAPKTTNLKLPGGDEVTVQKGTKGYEIPQVQGMPTQTAEPVPPGVDPKEYRKRLADAHVTNQEDAVKSAKAAADFQPIVDQAVAAYERAIGQSAIGPYAGSAPTRMLNKYVVGGEAEKARQDYEIARAALQARITAAQNKGEGAVSNFERQMYAAQFPELTAMEPEKQLEYLKQIQAQTKQTAAAGQIPSLGQAPQVGAVMQRPSVGGPAPQPPQAAPPRAGNFNWQTRENVQAARTDQAATIAQAKAAIANGMPPQEAAMRLQKVGINPAALNAVASPSAGAIY